ncbi:NAD-dependent epimerase/dehydratase family protein, partial [Streptomyces mirabilis]|uniref:SDR family oxidoreductase n=1 Tax=Streptomyces mirabilis TaxID=68239 RepID=UPI0034094BC6
MRILATGATGYIGHRVSAALARAGHTVLGLTRDTTSSAARDLLVNEVEPVKGDFADPDSWRGYLDGTDAVIHRDSSVDTPAFRRGRNRTPAEQGRESRFAAR